MRRRAADGFGRGASCDRVVIAVIYLRTRPAGCHAHIGLHQIREVGTTRMGRRDRRRSPTLAAEVHELRDRTVAASSCQLLETPNAHCRRQVGEQRAGTAGDTGHAQEAHHQRLVPWRTIGRTCRTEVVDRPLQSPCRHRDRHPGGVAQVEAAERADMMRDQIHLSEGGQGTTADRAAIAQATAVPETRDPRRQPPRSPKIGRSIAGETRGAILEPGRPAPAGGRPQGQQKRRQHPARRRHRRDGLARHARPNAEPHRECVGEIHVEAGRPHPAAQPEHVTKSSWRDAVGDRQTMKPARRQFVGLGTGSNRPPIPCDIPVSFANLDGEAGRAAHSRPSRCGAARRRDTGT